MRVEESPDRRHQHLVPVFQHVMPRVVEGMHFGPRQRAPETCEEVAVEHEIAQAPGDERGPVGIARQPRFHGLQQWPGAVARGGFVTWMLHDPDIAPLRDLPRFQRIMASIGAEASTAT